MTKSEAGKLGGQATLRRYGKSHFSNIGKKGGESTWKKYSLQPFGVNRFAMVDKVTNKIVAVHS